MGALAIRIGCAVTLGAVLAATPGVAKVVPCIPRRFVVVEPAPLLSGSRGQVSDADIVAYDQVGARVPLILGTCTPARARIAGTNKGTKVTAAYPKGSCPGVSGPLRLRALIDEGCTTWRGTLKYGKSRPLPFRATRSECGDRKFDPANEDHEQCDGDGTGLCAVCTASCTCLPASTTRTTTSTTSTTSTTLSPDRECGNGTREGDEECDGDPGGVECPAGSRPGGQVKCAEDCTLDFADCSASAQASIR